MLLLLYRVSCDIFLLRRWRIRRTAVPDYVLLLHLLLLPLYKRKTKEKEEEKKKKTEQGQKQE